MRMKKFMSAILAVAMLVSIMATGVYAADVVAKIGDDDYSSISDAVADADNGDVVVVVADGSAAQTCEQKGEDQDQGIAGDQGQKKADDRQEVEEHQGFLDPDQKGDQSREQAGNDVARGVG